MARSRCCQARRPPPPPTLITSPSTAAARPTASSTALLFLLRPRLGLHPRQLRRLETTLHALEVIRHRHGELTGVAKSVLRVDRQPAARQVAQLVVDAAGIEPDERIGQVAARGQHQGIPRRRRLEWGVPGQDLAKDRGQPEDVDPLIDPAGLATCLLGGDVGRRPQHAPDFGGNRVGPAPDGPDTALVRGPDGRRLVGVVAARQHLGQPPVHHLDLPERSHHDVRRLEVAVDHSACVRIGHRLADLREDAQEPREVVGRRRPRLEQLGEGPAPDQLHREVRAAIGERAQLVHRHDPRMLELAADLRLLDEPADRLGRVPVPLQEHLHRQVAAQLAVATDQDGAHATAGDLAEQVQPAGGRRNPGRCRMNDRRRGLLHRRVAEPDPRRLADRIGQRRQRVRQLGASRCRCDTVRPHRVPHDRRRRPVETMAERLEERARLLVCAEQRRDPPSQRHVAVAGRVQIGRPLGRVADRQGCSEEGFLGHGGSPERGRGLQTTLHGTGPAPGPLPRVNVRTQAHCHRPARRPRP